MKIRDLPPNPRLRAWLTLALVLLLVLPAGLGAKKGEKAKIRELPPKYQQTTIPTPSTEKLATTTGP